MGLQTFEAKMAIKAFVILSALVLACASPAHSAGSVIRVDKHLFPQVTGGIGMKSVGSQWEFGSAPYSASILRQEGHRMHCSVKYSTRNAGLKIKYHGKCDCKPTGTLESYYTSVKSSSKDGSMAGAICEMQRKFAIGSGSVQVWYNGKHTSC